MLIGRMSLVDLHRQIRYALSEGRNSRDRPAFSLIEVALGPDAQAQLQPVVRAALQERPLTGLALWWWRQYSLPLLLLATEVGYSYGHQDSVYWKKLEDELGASLNEEARTGIAQLFKGAGLPRGRPDTPWSNSARRIAWPVSQAVAPRWLHAPLLEVLAECPIPIDEDRRYLDWIDGELVRRSRLRLLFADRDLGHAVVMAVLFPDASGTDRLSAALRDRLRDDIAASAPARAARRRARARQVELRNTAPPPRPGAPLPSSGLSRASLRVDLQVHLEELALQLGPLRHPVLRQAKVSDRAAAFDERRPAPIAAIARGGHALRGAPSGDGRVFAERWTSKLSGQVGLVAAQVWASVARPLVFRRVGLRLARQVLDLGIPAHGELFVLLPQGAHIPPGLDPIGRCAEEWLCRADLESPAAQAALVGLGLQPQPAPRLTVVGPPPFEGPDGPALDPQDRVAVVVRSGEVEVTDHRGRVEPLRPGAHWLPSTEVVAEVRRPQDPPERAEALVLRRAPAPRAASAVRPAAGAVVSRAALSAGTLGLVVSEPRGAAGLRVRLSLLADGAAPRRAWSRALGVLPSAVAPDDPAWAWLRSEVPDGPRLRLRAELPGLGVSEWSLDGEEAPDDVDAWDRPEGRPVPAADAPGAGEEERGADGPAAPGAPASFVARFGVGPWSIALPADADGFSGPRGVLRLEGPLALPLPDVMVPRVERDAEAVHDAFCAAWAWARAEVVGAGGPLVRRAAHQAWERALVVTLCGQAWADAEAALRPSAWEPPWDVAASALLVDGVAWGEEGRPPADVAARARAALSELLRERWAWGDRREALLGVPRQLVDIVSDALLIGGCGVEDVDPPLPEPDVHRAFIAARGAWRVRPRGGLPGVFSALILPDSAREALDAALRDPATAGERAASCAAAVADWERAAKWSPEELQRLARLWVGPAGEGLAPIDAAGRLAVCGKAADWTRGARLARLLALEELGRLPLGGGR
jgi:hypothetical protein